MTTIDHASHRVDAAHNAVSAAADFLGFPGTGETATDDSLSAAAASRGLLARPVVLPPDWHRKDGPPALVRLRPGTPAAPTSALGPDHLSAIGWRRGWRLLPDGRRLTDTELAAVDRHAVELVPQLPPSAATRADWRRRCLAGTGRDALIVVVTSVLVAVISFLTPLLLGRLGNAVAEAAGPGTAVGAVAALLLLSVALAVWLALRVAAVSRLRTRIRARATGMLWAKAVRAPLSWHRSLTPSRRARLVLAPARVSGIVNDDVVIRLLDLLVVVAAVAAVATTTTPLVIGLALSLAGEGLILALLVRGEGQLELESSADSRASGALLGEIVGENEELRIWGTTIPWVTMWFDQLRQALSADEALRRRAARRQVVAALWPILTLSAVVLAADGTSVTFGDFVTASSAGIAATIALATAMTAVSAYVRGRAILTLADPVLAEDCTHGDRTSEKISGAVSASGVTVCVDPAGPPQLTGVSLSVAPGEFVAVVGRMGAGKSTLLRTLLGLEVPTEGEVTVDQIPLGAWDTPRLRRHIGVVTPFQASALFPTTIRDNVSLGRGRSTRDIWTALEEVGAADRIRRMGLQLQTPMTNDGQTLSTSERQLILLARALVDEPRLLILDSPVSALAGPHLGHIVDLLRGRRETRVVATGHLALARGADRVVVLDRGRIVADGPAREVERDSPEFRVVFGLPPE